MSRALLFLPGAILVLVQTGLGQISPGPLSNAHAHLEGISNCVRCHESGKELSGSKCLTCHTEINAQIVAQQGFHFFSSTASCISCHKEHLGKEARITRFDTQHFDHSKSGFALLGKHASITCDQCHADKNIRSPEIRKILSEHPHQTFLGLNQKCSSCHADKHNGTLSQECQSCHAAPGWTPANSFEHGKTRFALAGKHKNVECAKCHGGMQSRASNLPMLFGTKEYADCTPCHTSPHGSKFADKTCRSCHSPEGWKSVRSFNHSQTRFPLTGRHSTVSCDKCHPQSGANKARMVSFATKEFSDCQPCHTSPHKAGLNAQPCKTCHETASWKPSPEKKFDHRLTRFSLEGKHRSVKCDDCHKPKAKGTYAERFSLSFEQCTSCHADEHAGQFRERGDNDCAACHTVRSFKPSSFDIVKHAGTRFPLTGGHAAVPCSDCHIPSLKGGNQVVTYRGTASECQSCHKDLHAGQFEKGGETSCGRCHSPSGWKALVFDHETMSVFRLTGAHRNVPCIACHRKEQIGSAPVTRFKPLAYQCESCHQGRQG